MNQVRRVLWKNFILLLAIMFPAIAGAQPDYEAMRSQIENLRERIATMEKEQTKPDEPFILNALNKSITLGGLMELEAFWDKAEGGDATSDLQLSTVELSADVDINENIAGHLTMLWEDDESDKVGVDQAVIFLRHPVPFWSHYVTFSGGKMYLPFGKFNSSFISDPLTLELGESNNTAAVFGFRGDLVKLHIGAFNGDVDTHDDDQIDSWVASLELSPTGRLNFGISYLSDLAESDIELVQDENLYRSSVAAGGAYLSWQLWGVNLMAEYKTALENFSPEMVGAGEDLTGEKPRAWNVEMAWEPTGRWQMAVKAEGADDFQNDLKRYGAVVSRGLFRNTAVGVEYLYGEEDENENHTVMAQLALIF
ncbi:MAG: LbtU family siderophore porin [Geobacteraceae bacterium]|nr:LbtU family siderophore porin [Geobacteraceae bacterium]